MFTENSSEDLEGSSRYLARNTLKMWSTPPLSKLFSSIRNKFVFVLVTLLLIGVPLISLSSRRSALVKTNRPHPDIIEDPVRYAVIKENFPDPCLVTDVGGKHYAFATGNATVGINVQIASAISNDLSTWTLHRGMDALPVLGSWALQPNAVAQVWAPDVVQRPDGQWVLFYSALHHNHTRNHCIGSAISSIITGPYQPLSEPLACNFEAGGAIDPAHFHDPLTGSDFVLFKDDGNAIGSGGACDNSNLPNKPTPLRSQRVDSEDLVTPLGDAIYILDNFPEDGPDIEGPQAWYTDTPVPTYHLMYSSGCYHDESYHLKHIVCIANQTSHLVTSGVMTAWELCSWQLAISLPFYGFPEDQSQSWRVGDFLKTGDFLVPGQEDSKVYAPGGAGVDRQDGQIMVFHGDLNLDFFKDPDHVTRMRGMFVAGLAYPEKKDRLTMGSLQFRGGQKQKSLRERLFESLVS